MTEPENVLTGSFTIDPHLLQPARIAPTRWELRRVNENTVDWFPVPLRPGGHKGLSSWAYDNWEDDPA